MSFGATKAWEKCDNCTTKAPTRYMAAWNALKEGVGSVPEFFSGNLGQPAL